MNKLFNHFSLKVGLLAIASVSFVFAAVPKSIEHAKADVSCTNYADGSPISFAARFNPFPQSSNPGDCQDYPFMQGEIIRGGQKLGYTQGTLNAQPGDEVQFVLYVHNGAAQNGGDSAKNIQLSASATTGNSSNHSVSAFVSSSNAGSLSGGMNISTPSGASLQLVPGSEQWFQGSNTTAMGGLSNFVNSSISLPDQQACFNFVRFIYFNFTVVGQTVVQPTPTPTPTVIYPTPTPIQPTPTPVQPTPTPVTPQTGTANLSIINFCVGDVPQYTVNASRNLGGLDIVWSSTTNSKSAVYPPESNSFYGQILDAVGNWSGFGSKAWTVNDVGNWTKTASIFNPLTQQIVATSQPFQFTIRDCSAPTPTPTPIQQVSVITATASASATAFASCPNGATASASASASATATGSTYTDAYNKAYNTAYAQALASASAKVVCPGSPAPTPTPIQPTPTPVQPTPTPISFCASNTVIGSGLVISSVSQVGNSYDALVNWSSSGSHQVSITSNGQSLTAGAASGSIVVHNLQPGNVYTFVMTDVTCNAQIATASLTVPALPTPTPTPTQTSNTNIFNHSFNTTTNNNSNNTNTIFNNVTGNNNNNVGNNTIVNGNNNTVTNVNTCVNNSCNTTSVKVVYAAAQNIVPVQQTFGQLSITKQVKETYNGYFQNSVTANNNDRLTFQVTVTNTGSQPVNNVIVTDNLPGGLNYVNGSLQFNNNYNYNNYNNGSYYYNNQLNNISLGTLSAGQQAVISFDVTVSSNGNVTLQNIATASGSNVGTVQASASVFVNGNSYCNNCYIPPSNNVSLVYSKSAFNNTQNANATSVTANRDDYITYTLTVSNNSNTQANSFVITDDLSQVLPYASISDNGGGTLNGNVISFPAINIPAYGSVSKTFQVRVSYFLANGISYQMTNTYGNTVIININSPNVTFVAPKTGADSFGFTFAGLLTTAFAVVKKRKDILKLIFT